MNTQTTRRWWCEHAWLGGAGVARSVVVEATAGVITSFEPGVETCPPGAVRLDGVTLPGLANAHSHAFHRALRGRSQIGTGSFWTWREQMYALAEQLDPDSYYALARGVYAEMVLAGVTCVGEFHYLHHASGGAPYSDPNAMTAALVTAAADAGLRITLLDTCYLHGGLDSDGSLLAANPVQQRFVDGSAAVWADRVDAAEQALASETVRFGAAVHSVRAVDPAAIEAVARHALDRGWVLHAHVSEQPAENSQCLAAYGATPVALLDRHAALGPRFSAVHATHLTPDDVALLGERDATVCLCPTTERDLADGIASASALVAAGSRLSLGSDSHAVIDLFEEARAVELDERAVTGVRGHHTARTLMSAATLDGHRSLGWDTAGKIEVGAPADLVTVGLDSVRLAGAAIDSMLESIVFAAAATDVRQVIVGGEPIVVDGAHRRIDAAAELARWLGRYGRR
jgi:formiminoglutamate deiminase